MKAALEKKHPDLDVTERTIRNELSRAWICCSFAQAGSSSDAKSKGDSIKVGT